MANIRKSFNFRTGLQVDNDNFVVNSNGLVGIGTSAPQEYLFNVYGDARVTDKIISGRLDVTGDVNVTSGITTVGVLTAIVANLTGNAQVEGSLTVGSLKIGQSEPVTELIGYARTTFLTDNGGIGIHTTSKIGINTTISPGESDNELVVTGDATVTQSLTVDSLLVTNIATASTFSGSGALLTNIPNSATTGTSNNTASALVARDSSGNFSAGTVTANLTGTASLASNLTSSPSITVSSVNSTGSITGTEFNANTVSVAGSITAATAGFGTYVSSNAQIGLSTTATASLQVLSNGSYSQITFGKSLTLGSNNGQVRYGYANALGDAQYSTATSLDVINYGTGNLNFYLDPSGGGTAFNWLTSASLRAMVLTQSGNLGINVTSPSEKLDVGGNITASGTCSIGSSFTAETVAKSGGSSAQFLKADGSVDTNTYLSTVGDGSALSGVVTSISGSSGITASQTGGTVSITKDNDTVSIFKNVIVRLDSDVAQSLNIDSNGIYINNSSGIVTSTGGFTSGTGGAVQISVSGTTLTFTVNGVGSTSLTLFP